MREFLQLAIAGAATGAIYSLIAAGLTVSYTATGIFNLAYGAIAFDSALLYYELNTGLGWPIVPAFLFVIVIFCPLLGLLLNVAIFRPLATAPDAAKIMATVGLLVALPAIGRCNHRRRARGLGRRDVGESCRRHASRLCGSR